MCGRYFFKIEDIIAFDTLRKKIDQITLFEYATDEIFPSNDVLVLVGNQNDFRLDVMKWGIRNYQNKAIVNARSEGISEKKMFKPLLHNRCLIPCNGFYEWLSTGTKRKQKVYIQKEAEPLFYLAGIYDDQKQFVIVTGESSGNMKSIHHRTPIIISNDQITPYLTEQIDFEVDNDALLFEKEESQGLEQLCLFEEE